MDLATLPSILQLKIFCFVDPFSLLSAVQTCQYWRQFLTSGDFLEIYCQTRYAVSFCDLLELERWECIFVNTQRIMFQKTPILEIDQADYSLLKIYMFQYRLVWASRRIVTPRSTSYIPDIDSFKLDDLDKFMPRLKRFIIRLHAAIPLDFFRLQCTDYYSNAFSIIKLTSPGNLGYRRYEMGTNEEDTSHVTAILEVCTHECDYGPTLKVAFYDDHSWRPIFQGPMLPSQSSPQPGARIAYDATIEEIHHLANPTVRRFYDWLRTHDYGNPLLGLFVPHYSNPIKLNQFELFQTECTLRLEKAIESTGQELTQKLEMRVRNCSRKVVTFLDSRYPCVVLDHGKECDVRRSSPILRVALIRALRRLINSVYLPEVQELYNSDRDTSRLMHAFIATVGERSSLRIKNHKGAGQVNKIFQTACCHQAHPDLWPALVCVKAIDDMPRLASEVEDDVISYIKSGFRVRPDDKYLYSFGYALSVLEGWSTRSDQ